MTNNLERYTYRVTWSEEDREYVGSCVEFPSLSWLDESPERALSGVRAVVSKCLQDMQASGEPVPEPLSTRPYSGKFMVRVSPHLHRKLATQAAEIGMSLNRLVASKLSQ
ncbi:type II toxin-antitoxin system HicB family antitoxin [Synechococcus sp. PCC 7336]|uniref:type II toxin-antitoxin system HicB family antitoxin n=1 Tax=Synechococcus sp. PCC 7336 TaxID=195250 RepID=UPI0008FBE906|nr:type II toxin-antitoxin system HicB family antitoxin [Synechococcus sp. PCC 7336]